MANKFLIVGESGSGKTTICDKLEELYGYKVIKSYTTRSRRKPDDNDHIYISDNDVEKYRFDMIAYTYFDDNHYFATGQQLSENDLYIIDPDGIKWLKENCKNKYNIIIIYIKVPEHQRIERMNARNDDLIQILDRLKNDKIKFKSIIFDYAVPNNDLDKCVKIIDSIINIENR